MKLIDRDKLIDALNTEGILDDSQSEYYGVFNLITRQPIVYDVDKVCEEIEKLSEKFTHSRGNGQYDTVEYVNTEDAIGVVQSGGVTSTFTKTLTPQDILNKFDFEQRRAYGNDEIKRIVYDMFK